ncbi:MAG: TolC family protein [Candidatus Margulisbacteria bacterium]|nr:TolC family protein [Candidatus Margulisiibacteriota bacterium]
MKSVKRSIIILMVLALGLPAFAITWKEAVALAEKNNLQLKSAAKDLESSEWSLKRSYTNFLPQLSFSASKGDSAGVGSYSYGFSVSESLFQGFENLYGVQYSASSLDQQRASWLSTRADVMYALRSAYIELLYIQEKIALLEKILKERTSNTALITLRYESGKEDKGNLMATQSEQKQAEYDLSAARRELDLARLNLSQLLQQEVKEAEALSSIAVPPLPDYKVLLISSPDYQISELAYKMAEINYKKSIAGLLPSLSLSASYRNSGSDWPPAAQNNSWSLSLSYPFFPGGSNLIDRIMAKVDMEKAQQDFNKNRDDLRYSLQDAYEALVDASESLAVSEFSLAASLERAEISRARYINGLVNYDEWSRIDNIYIQALKTQLSNKKQAWLAEALWHKTYGGAVE